MASPAIQRARFLAPGDKLGKHELIRQIAVGGMAELYLARSQGLEGFEKLVVLKRILPQLAGNASFVSMFLNEARLAATLHHPNIAQVFDIDQDGSDYFFAMEYIHGEDLGHLVASAADSGIPIALDAALTLVAGLCAGLHYAHEKVGPDGKPLNVVHRDVSPSNVLVSYDGAVKLVDFGIARAGSNPTTARGGLKGKIAYMSPEQCRGKVALDRRSDVFSIGTMLYELTTGRLPFTDETEYGILNQIVNRDAEPPSRIVEGFSPALEAIVMRALARNPDQRYATALEMQKDIEDYAHENRLRVSPLVLARLMGTLYPARLEEWDHARAQGAFFVEQHVVRTMIENRRGTDNVKLPEDDGTAAPPMSDDDTSVGPPAPAGAPGWPADRARSQVPLPGVAPARPITAAPAPRGSSPALDAGLPRRPSEAGMGAGQLPSRSSEAGIATAQLPRQSREALLGMGQLPSRPSDAGMAAGQPPRRPSEPTVRVMTPLPGQLVAASAPDPSAYASQQRMATPLPTRMPTPSPGRMPTPVPGQPGAVPIVQPHTAPTIEMAPLSAPLAGMPPAGMPLDSVMGGSAMGGAMGTAPMVPMGTAPMAPMGGAPASGGMLVTGQPGAGPHFPVMEPGEVTERVRVPAPPPMPAMETTLVKIGRSRTPAILLGVAGLVAAGVVAVIVLGVGRKDVVPPAPPAPPAAAAQPGESAAPPPDPSGAAAAKADDGAGANADGSAAGAAGAAKADDTAAKPDDGAGAKADDTAAKADDGAKADDTAAKADDGAKAKADDAAKPSDTAAATAKVDDSAKKADDTAPQDPKTAKTVKKPTRPRAKPRLSSTKKKTDSEKEPKWTPDSPFLPVRPPDKK